MALTNCKECGQQLSTEAKACPQCGAPRRDGLFKGLIKVFFGTALGVIVLAWIFSGTSSSRSPYTSSGDADSETAVPDTPPLEVQSWRCDTEHGYVFVIGEVKNVSTRKLENVTAVGEFRNKAGELVKTEDALLEYNPIMPGQSSPFRASGTENPKIERCALGFKYLLGGGAIDFTEKNKPRKQR